MQKLYCGFDSSTATDVWSCNYFAALMYFPFPCLKAENTLGPHTFENTLRVKFNFKIQKKSQITQKKYITAEINFHAVFFKTGKYITGGNAPPSPIRPKCILYCFFGRFYSIFLDFFAASRNAPPIAVSMSFHLFPPRCIFYPFSTLFYLASL